MMPIGRQCASGLSLLSSACRFFTSSAAQDRMGRPPCTPVPMSRNRFIPVSAGRVTPGGGGAPPVPDAFSNAAGLRGFSQIPERSGLPSDVRGADPLRSGSPVAVFGTRSAGYAGHCADDQIALAASIAVRQTRLKNVFIRGLQEFGGASLEFLIYHRGSLAICQEHQPCQRRSSIRYYPPPWWDPIQDLTGIVTNCWGATFASHSRKSPTRRLTTMPRRSSSVIRKKPVSISSPTGKCPLTTTSE